MRLEEAFWWPAESRLPKWAQQAGAPTMLSRRSGQPLPKIECSPSGQKLSGCATVQPLPLHHEPQSALAVKFPAAGVADPAALAARNLAEIVRVWRT
jgi:hypothetical protein